MKYNIDWFLLFAVLKVEGAWATGGKGFSNWDIFTQRTPGIYAYPTVVFVHVFVLVTCELLSVFI